MDNNQSHDQIEQASAAIAKELLAEAEAERQTRASARWLLRILKLLTIIFVLIIIFVTVRPLSSAKEWWDDDRKAAVEQVVQQLGVYKLGHSGNLPMITSRRQWEREFIQPYLLERNFPKEPKTQADYRFEINRRQLSSKIVEANDARIIYIDQGYSCRSGGVIQRAGNSVVAIRLLLESGAIYCADTN